MLSRSAPCSRWRLFLQCMVQKNPDNRKKKRAPSVLFSFFFNPSWNQGSMKIFHALRASYLPLALHTHVSLSTQTISSPYLASPRHATPRRTSVSRTMREEKDPRRVTKYPACPPSPAPGWAKLTTLTTDATVSSRDSRSSVGVRPAPTSDEAHGGVVLRTRSTRPSPVAPCFVPAYLPVIDLGWLGTRASDMGTSGCFSEAVICCRGPLFRIGYGCPPRLRHNSYL